MIKGDGFLVLSLKPGESVVCHVPGVGEIEFIYSRAHRQNGITQMRLAMKAPKTVAIERKTFNNGGYVDPARKK